MSAALEKMVTADEVAAMLGVTGRTVRNYINSGHLEAYRLPGGIYRIPLRAAQALLQPVVAQ